MCQQIDKEGKTQLLRPTPNSEKSEKIGESWGSSKSKSVKKMASMNYLFSFVSKLVLPFDSGRSGSFSSNFLVGFRGFDSFQFRHLVVAGQKWTHTLFSLFRERREIQSVGFIQENLLSDGHLSGNKGRKSRPKLLSQKSWPWVKLVAYISCHYF